MTMLRTKPLLAALSAPLLVGLAAAVASAAAPVAPEVARLYTLVENGGFEDGQTLPAWWNRHPPRDDGGNRLLRDTSVAHAGQASALIVTLPPAPGAAVPNMQWNRYNIPVEGGSALIVSGWVKASAAQQPRAGCHFYGEGHWHLGFSGVHAPKPDGQWAYFCETVAVPEQARAMGFVLYGGGPGNTWYDDVAVLATPSVEATRATPRLDGRLDDPCWGSGHAISQFVVHGGSKVACQKTRAWIAYDDTALYVAFDCPHPPGATLRAAADRHDADTWLDDSVEVFLDPNHDHRSYYQYCVNCRGQIRDSRGMDPQWESGAEAAARRSSDAWTVEIKIPYDRLEIGLSAGTTWGINLVRNDRVNRETVTWSLGGFHDPRRFGNVALRPDLWLFRRDGIGRELARRAEEIAGLRREMGEAGMTPAAMVGAERVLAQAEQRIAGIRRQVAVPVRDDEQTLTELRRAMAELAQVVPQARTLATQCILMTAADAADGFRLAIAHALQKVPRTGPWSGGVLARDVQLVAARDETESFQLVVMPADTGLRQVTVEAAALRGPGGPIPVEWHRVDYVETVAPRYPTEYVGWWPDPLLPPAAFGVAAGQRQPLWFSISVPRDATPGIYAGQVTIRHGCQSLAVPVKLRVRSFRLPRPGTLATAFGNYADVLSLNYYGKGGYRQHLSSADYRRWCEFMGRYRLGPKNAGAEYASVVRDGTAWRADLSAVKATIGDLASKYYAPFSVAINRLPSAPQPYRPDYHPDTSVWARQTAAIAREWRQQGLPREVYVYGVDEPAPGHYPLLAEAYRKLRAAVPDVPIMQTVNQQEPEELAGLVGIWCPIGNRLDADFYAQRRKAGDTLWVYVCCGPTHPYANFFVDRPATEHRVLFWQTWQHEATGVLYWCVCFWQGLPVPGAGKPCWPDVALRFKDLETARSFKVNGDGVLLYPGPGLEPYPSLRLEVIRDGIEDYEYLALLSRLLQEVKILPDSRRPPASLLAQAEGLCRVPAEISRSMAEYTQDPHEILGRRAAVGDMIERLEHFTPARKR
jgi:hypothetical protein